MYHRLLSSLVSDMNTEQYAITHDDIKPNDLFPGDWVFVQTARVGPRAAAIILSDGQVVHRDEFALRSEIGYQVIDAEALRQDMQKLTALAHRVYSDLEFPVFGAQSPEMPYSVEDFIGLFNRPDVMIYLAWKRCEGVKAERLVGYLVAETYQGSEDIPEGDRTTYRGEIAPEPEAGALIFDSFAVNSEEQGHQIGSILVELMLQGAPPGTEQLVTFAVAPGKVPKQAAELAYPFTLEMLTKHPRIDILEAIYVPDYRGVGGYYTLARILPTRKLVKGRNY